MMFTFHPYINICGETTVTDMISVREEEKENGVTAVFVDALSKVRSADRGYGLIDGDKGVCIDTQLAGNIKGFMANYRLGEYWCVPYFGTDMSKIPDETQMLMMEMENGEFCVVVPVVNDRYKNVLVGKGEKEFTIRVYSWCDKLYTCRGLSFVYAVGRKPMELVEKCVRTALSVLNSGVRHRTERRFPELFEYLGWCSWDSMQIRVCEEGLLQKCEEFKEKKIPVKWAILDDMWAEVRDFYRQEYDHPDEMGDLMGRSSLWHFEADPLRFPKGLAHCIYKIKEYGICVGIWHPTTGYWRGIDPDGEAYKQLKDYLIETPGHIYVPDWHRDKSYMYYKTLHDFFRKCGADFVKIDNQSMTRRYYKNVAPVGQVLRWENISTIA